MISPRVDVQSKHKLRKCTPTCCLLGYRYFGNRAMKKAFVCLWKSCWTTSQLSCWGSGCISSALILKVTCQSRKSWSPVTFLTGSIWVLKRINPAVQVFYPAWGLKVIKLQPKKLYCPSVFWASFLQPHLVALAFCCCLQWGFVQASQSNSRLARLVLHGSYLESQIET